jgi:hypothetical protein
MTRSRWRAKSTRPRLCAAERLDLSDAHIYVDDGVAGAEFANQPGFLRLMNGLKPQPPFRVLIMSEESRASKRAP